jgi:L,D-peptidoglycan transpeptidase YkuD (ErfK/YbiS/YcfS/YnhG family)
VSNRNQRISVRVSPSNPQQGLIRVAGLTLRCALGRSGIGNFKREGDGKTPRAAMRLISGFWRVDRVAKPDTRLPMQPARPGMIWCDAPNHGAYNRLSRLPLAASHETMCREDHVYDICLVLDWNIAMRKRGGGSAIFLHLARPGYSPTEGCIAVSAHDMRCLLKVLVAGSVVTVI